jgi:hypothetical protein
MTKNRVATAADILIGFVGGRWHVAYAMIAAQRSRIAGGSLSDIPGSRKPDNSEIKIRGEMKRALENLISGTNVDSIVTTINKHTARPLDLVLWKQGESRSNVPYRFFQRRRPIMLGKRKVFVLNAAYPHRSARHFFYWLLRQTIEDGTIERLKCCKQCKQLFYQRSTKANFCRDRCRWDWNNHSENRARHYIKGVWIKKLS